MPTRARPAKQRLTAYETEQVQAIAAWKSKAINPVAETWKVIALQAAKLVTAFVPDGLVRSGTELAYSAARSLAAPESIAREAGVKNIQELREKPLQECDRLARKVGVAARGLAAIEGAATGAGGPVLTLVDVPLLFASALRTIIRISHCYGYRGDQPSDRYYNLGVLTIATAGSLATRLERLEQLDDLKEILVEEIQVDVVKSELLSFLFQLEVFEEVPGIGIVSGSLLNLSFMSGVENTARRVFQERWLKDNGKIREIEPAIKPERGMATGWAGLIGRAVAPVCYGVTFAAALPVFTAAALGRRSGRPAVNADFRGRKNNQPSYFCRG